jgi:hypothetical protein
MRLVPPLLTSWWFYSSGHSESTHRRDEPGACGGCFAATRPPGVSSLKRPTGDEQHLVRSAELVIRGWCQNSLADLGRRRVAKCDVCQHLFGRALGEQGTGVASEEAAPAPRGWPLSPPRFVPVGRCLSKPSARRSALSISSLPDAASGPAEPDPRLPAPRPGIIGASTRGEHK